MFGALVPFLLFFLNFEKVKFQKLGPGTSSGAWVHDVWQIFWGVKKISVTCLICQAMIYLLQQWLESESVCLVETYKRPGWL